MLSGCGDGPFSVQTGACYPTESPKPYPVSVAAKRDQLPCMPESHESTSRLAEIKASKTPYLNALSEKERVFVLAYFGKGNQSDAATKAGYSRAHGHKLSAKPHIKAFSYPLTGRLLLKVKQPLIPSFGVLVIYSEAA